MNQQVTLVDIRARIHDMQQDEAHRDILTWTENGQTNTISARLPVSQADWWAKRRATDRVLNELGGVVTRVGDDTLGEFWSLYDAADALAEIEPQFAGNIRAHIDRALHQDLFHISANTDPKGDRSKPPQAQDPDMSLHVVRETDAGIIVRGAKFETAAAYANLAYVKPKVGTNKFGGECITYEGIGSTKKWERLDSYGPKFVENIVQATSRDILCYAMKTLRCCSIVMHIHDELVIEADPRMSLDVLCEQMGRTPPWAKGLKLRADGYTTPFYKKD